MKIIIKAITALVILAALPAYSSDWQVHLSACDYDRLCAKEQAKARDLWESQPWDEDLKDVCRMHVSASYIRYRDYVLAVNCVFGLQTVRNEKEALNAQTEKDRAEANYYRRNEVNR
jgi:hypothetical protein